MNFMAGCSCGDPRLRGQVLGKYAATVQGYGYLEPEKKMWLNAESFGKACRTRQSINTIVFDAAPVSFENHVSLDL
jgi:hypothetical protein